MSQPNAQETDTGLSQEHQEKQLSAESKPTKTAPRKPSAKATSQSKSGSPISDPQKKTSTSENEPASGSRTIRQKKSSQMPVPKLPEKRDEQSEILARLKVKPEELQKAPPITRLLKSAAGGRKLVLEAMRFAASDEVIGPFLSKYDSLSEKDRKSASFEAIGLSAGLNLNHLYGSASLAIATYCANQSRLIAVSNHPKVMQKRVEYALIAGGEKDRTALDIMVGSQQSAKGPTFIGKAIFGGGESSKKDDEDDDESDSQPALMTKDEQIDALFPSLTSVQEKLVPIRQRLLEK